MRSIFLKQSKPKQIRKKLDLIANSPDFHKYAAELENDSMNFWSSPSPSNSFERYRLGSDMLPPFSTPPDDNIYKFLKKENKKEKGIKSIKIDTDFSNSIKISLEANDDLIFTLED